MCNKGSDAYKGILSKLFSLVPPSPSTCVLSSSSCLTTFALHQQRQRLQLTIVVTRLITALVRALARALPRALVLLRTSFGAFAFASVTVVIVAIVVVVVASGGSTRWCIRGGGEGEGGETESVLQVMVSYEYI